MDSSDMTFLRVGVAGVVALPVQSLALKRDAGDQSARWRSWLTVALLVAPLFGLLVFTALLWTPAAHAAVLRFTAMRVMVSLMSAVFVGDRAVRLASVADPPTGMKMRCRIKPSGSAYTSSARPCPQSYATSDSRTAC